MCFYQMTTVHGNLSQPKILSSTLAVTENDYDQEISPKQIMQYTTYSPPNCILWNRLKLLIFKSLYFSLL